MAERVYMFYLLEGMIDGSGCWAYTHYNFGAWENSIQGLTLEQEKDLIDKLRNNTRNAIGTWLDDRFGVGSSLQLYKENGRFFMEANFPDKSVHIEEVIESQFDEIRRFVPVEDNGHGEYFEVDKTGELKYYSPDGLFKTLTPFLL